MTLAEKLRFLADRIEDEKQFSIGREDDIFRFRNSELRYVGQERTYDYSPLSLKNILSLPMKLKPQWVFTEDEKAILRNLPEQYKWIARDQSDVLCTFTPKPFKKERLWVRSTLRAKDVECLSMYNHLFKSIQWSDDEPCEFRKYL